MSRYSQPSDSQKLALAAERLALWTNDNMDSLEANFPHIFPKTRVGQEVAAGFKLRGDRGLASNDVLRSGNEVQCDQAFLSGILDEQIIIKVTILSNLKSFGLQGEEAFKHDPEPVVLKAADKLKEIYEEVTRLKSRPELFSDDRQRKEFFQQSDKTFKSISSILRGQIPVLEAYKAQMENPKVVDFDQADPAAPRQPWATWCGSLSLAAPAQPQTLRDFQQQNPDMLLVGTQIIPHMGVLIAEHWRNLMGEIITSIGTEHGEPEVLDQYPKLQSMLVNTRLGRNGKYAVLKFCVSQPTATQAGQYFAFGPQENVAKMARYMALLKSNRDVTSIGHPTAVMVGVFLNKEDVKKMLPHFHPLEQSGDAQK